MLLLLDLQHGAILEGPLHDVDVVAGALDVVGLGDGGPELVELLELDVVPDVGKRGLDDGRLVNGGGVWDGGRHCGWS